MFIRVASQYHQIAIGLGKVEERQSFIFKLNMNFSYNHARLGHESSRLGDQERCLVIHSSHICRKQCYRQNHCSHFRDAFSDDYPEFQNDLSLRY